MAGTAPRRRVSGAGPTMIGWRGGVKASLTNERATKVAAPWLPARKKAAMLYSKELEAKGKDWWLGVELL